MGGIALWESVAGGDGKSKLQLLDVVAGHAGPVITVGFSADTLRIHSSSVDGSMYIWNLGQAIVGTSVAKADESRLSVASHTSLWANLQRQR